MDQLSISDRLRQFKNQKGLTTQRMADATGVSRRTLESYMRLKGAPLPGLESLRQISQGLGVSIDWLVVGDEAAQVREVLITRVCAERASLPVLQTLISKLKSQKDAPLAENLAMEIGAQAAISASALLTELVTSGQLFLLMKKFEAESEKLAVVKIAGLEAALARLEADQKKHL